MNIGVPAEGNIREALYVIVGECPGKTETLIGKPFVGKSGKYLRQTLQNIGITETCLYITNVIPAERIDTTKPPTAKEIHSNLSALREQLILKHPTSKIFAFGKTAEIALELLGHAFIAFPHPSYVLRFNKKKEFEARLKEVVCGTCT